MRNWRLLLRGLLIALASFAFVLGGFSLSLVEGGLSQPVASPTLPPPASATDTPLPPLTPPAESSTPIPPTATWTHTPTLTLPPPPTNCPPPAGWVPYIVQPGDTLQSLAASTNVSPAALSQANCLLTTGLLPGVVLYIPPTPTATAVPCGPPAGWVIYIVRVGDTLYHLSQVYGVSVAELQQANCLGQSSVLRVGQQLYVPSGPTRTPTFTPTRSSTSAPTGTPTRTSNTPSATIPTATLPSATPTPSATFTAPVSSPTPSASSSSTDTPAPTATASSTPTPSPTSTP